MTDTVPDFQSFFRPLLETLADNKIYTEHNLGVSIKETYHIKKVDTDYFEGDVV